MSVKLENIDNCCLLCSEDKPDKCHRKLLAEYLQNNFPSLKVDSFNIIMKKYILCLANSHKYNERCIAGVELNNKGGNNDFSFVFTREKRLNGFDQFHSCEHGEISSEIAEQIELSF